MKVWKSQKGKFPLARTSAIPETNKTRSDLRARYLTTFQRECHLDEFVKASMSKEGGYWVCVNYEPRLPARKAVDTESTQVDSRSVKKVPEA
jgi:hypothetical protein